MNTITQVLDFQVGQIVELVKTKPNKVQFDQICNSIIQNIIDDFPEDNLNFEVIRDTVFEQVSLKLKDENTVH